MLKIRGNPVCCHTIYSMQKKIEQVLVNTNLYIIDFFILVEFILKIMSIDSIEVSNDISMV